jgi:hypothetical protein
MCLSRKERKKLQSDLLHFLALAKPEEKLAKIVELWSDYSNYSKADRELLDKLVDMLVEKKA